MDIQWNNIKLNNKNKSILSTGSIKLNGITGIYGDETKNILLKTIWKRLTSSPKTNKFTTYHNEVKQFEDFFIKTSITPQELRNETIREIFSEYNEIKTLNSSNKDTFDHYLKIFELDLQILDKKYDSLNISEKGKVSLISELIKGNMIYFIQDIDKILTFKQFENLIDFFKHIDIQSPKTLAFTATDKEFITHCNDILIFINGIVESMYSNENIDDEIKTINSIDVSDEEIYQQDDNLINNKENISQIIYKDGDNKIEEESENKISFLNNTSSTISESKKSDKKVYNNISYSKSIEDNNSEKSVNEKESLNITLNEFSNSNNESIKQINEDIILLEEDNNISVTELKIHLEKKGFIRDKLILSEETKEKESNCLIFFHKPIFLAKVFSITSKDFHKSFNQNASKVIIKSLFRSYNSLFSLIFSFISIIIMIGTPFIFKIIIKKMINNKIEPKTTLILISTILLFLSYILFSNNIFLSKNIINNYNYESKINFIPKTTNLQSLSIFLFSKNVILLPLLSIYFSILSNFSLFLNFFAIFSIIFSIFIIFEYFGFLFKYPFGIIIFSIFRFIIIFVPQIIFYFIENCLSVIFFIIYPLSSIIISFSAYFIQKCLETIIKKSNNEKEIILLEKFIILLNKYHHDLSTKYYIHIIIQVLILFIIFSIFLLAFIFPIILKKKI